MQVVSWVLLLYFWQLGDISHDLRVSKGSPCIANILVNAIHLPPALLGDA